MRVVFFNRSFYPDVTATGQLLTELCQGLVKDYGWEVTVVAGRAMVVGDPHERRGFIGLFKRESFCGIEVLRVNNTTFEQSIFLGRILNYFSYFVLAFFASFFIKKIDLVVTLTDPPIVVLLGLWVCRCKGVPLVISIRDLFPEAARGLQGVQNRLMDFILEKINQLCFSRATSLVALGKSMRSRLVEKGIQENKITIIPDWANTEEIFPIDKRNEFSLRYGLADYFVVMYAGNIGVSCGLEFVMPVAEQLRSFEDIVFVFVGEGIMKKRLQNIAQQVKLENVRFFPYQRRALLPQVFSTADCFLLTLKNGLSGYSIPSKIYSILASGRPYIACVDNDSDISEITERFQCGVLCPSYDSSQLKDKIIYLYRQKDLRVKMGLNARQASYLFDLRKGVKKYHELFQRLLNS